MLRDLGLSGQVHPVQADARALPFEDGFFDVIVSIDAWAYFGTDDHFLPGLLRVLRPDGALGMATPAMARDVRDLGAIAKHIGVVVGVTDLAWPSSEWWQQHWVLTGLLGSLRA